MKKIFLLATMAFAAVTASAQIETGSRFGISIPLGLSSYPDVSGSGNAFCFGAEVNYEYNFTKNFYFSTALGMSTRGTKIDYKDSNYTYEGNIYSLNITIPVNIGGRIILSDKAAIFGQVGAYFSLIALPAEIKAEDRDYVLASNWGDFDLGISGRVGVELSRVQLFGGYEYGLLDIWEHNNVYSCDNTLVLGISYMF